MTKPVGPALDFVVPRLRWANGILSRAERCVQGRTVPSDEFLRGLPICGIVLGFALGREAKLNSSSSSWPHPSTRVRRCDRDDLAIFNE